MPIKKDDSGRRWIQVEVEVPGSPEEVWRAIASGPGITSWFVPTKFEVDDDGKPVRVISNFGPGMESIAEVKAWNPPERMEAESADLGPEAPKVGTEWIVEARDGGRCTVRVVHSLFASTDDWDKQLEGWESGWPDFFRILDLYLTHFPGQPGVSFQLHAMTSEPTAAAWARFSEALGFVDPVADEQREGADGAPPLRAWVERRGGVGHPEELLVRLDKPAPGLGHFFAMPMNEQTFVSVRIHFYGEQAQASSSENEPRWREWLEQLFPPAAAGA